MPQKAPTQVLPKLSLRQQRIFDFLNSHNTTVLSTIDPNGNPHGVVVYYIVSPDFEISFLTRSHTKKHDNLVHDNRVMATIYDQATQTIAQVTGEAYEINDGYDVNTIATKVLEASRKNGPGNLAPVINQEAGPYVAFTIKPCLIQIARYAEHPQQPALFDSIESFECDLAA